VVLPLPVPPAMPMTKISLFIGVSSKVVF
jgi:hypothetical protein